MANLHITRREALLSAAAGLLGVPGRSWLGNLARAADAGPRPKSCIVLWLSGGPSQLDTFE